MLTTKELWRACEGSHYVKRRIPGMIVTNRGTLILYNEARLVPHDWAPIDIFCQRSEDGGESFGEPIYLAEGNAEHQTVNNPVMMQDKNGRIHFLYCEDYTISGGRVLRRFSDDDGVTWSDVIDITAGTAPELRNVFALGPGHGICTSGGTLIVPVWFVPKRFRSPLRFHHPSEISTLYSCDCGETWQLGDILHSTADVHSPNETVAVELSDGRIYLSIRQVACQRAKAVSINGYSNWQAYEPVYELIDPICFGSIAAFRRQGLPHTLVFANCEHSSKRQNVVVKASVDDGASFPYRLVLDEEQGGYVEVAIDANRGNIYVLYETNYGESLQLATLGYEDLVN